MSTTVPEEARGSELAGLRAEIAELRATRVEVVREPLTYERNAPRSYFHDRIMATQGDLGAETRLQRHAVEMRVELPALERQARDSRGPLESRVNPNVSQGQGGYGAPPLWLIADTAIAPRAKRVVASLIPNFTLPAGVQSINLPQLTKGTYTLGEPNLADEPDRDVVDAALSSPVVTITGDADVALQLLEQSPQDASLDMIYFKDMLESYDDRLETMLMSGLGTGGQFTGYFYGAPSVSTITFAQATPTGSLLLPFMGQAYAQVGNNRKLAPEVWMMRTARWAWIGTSEDSAGQPLAVPGHVPAPPLPHTLDDDVPTPVGMFLGAPIYTNDTIFETFGSTTNQDFIVCCRPTDSILWESEPHMQVMTDVLSGTLEVRLQLRRYCAAVHRYPSGIGLVTGSGMVVQNGFS